MATILIAGGTGLVGKRLSAMLTTSGHEVTHLSRKVDLKAPYPTYAWDVARGFLDEKALLKADVIVNLAGAGVADSRWTEAQKKLITDSRVQSNELIVKGFQKISKVPKAYISAAAVGFYGNRGDELLTEESAAGSSGFLSESCIAWEKSIAEVADKLQTRTVLLRIGIVLSLDGGALPKMLLPFKVGLATYFGDGEQYQSWIHIDDLCSIFVKAIEDENMSGIFNAVAPNPVTNKVFTQKIKDSLKTPALLISAPAFALRLGMGEMADVVLGGARVSNEKLLKTGFQFQFTDSGAALEDLLR